MKFRGPAVTLTVASPRISPGAGIGGSRGPTRDPPPIQKRRTDLKHIGPGRERDFEMPDQGRSGTERSPPKVGTSLRCGCGGIHNK